MHVQAWSQNLTPDHAAAQGVRHARSLHDLLASSDFVSIHLVLRDRTRGLVDHAAFESMRPFANLINTARAAIVDQAALLDVLQRRRIAGACLDVFDLEPLPAAHPSASCPTCSPHHTSATSRGATTLPTSPRSSKTSRPIWSAGRSGFSAVQAAQTERRSTPVAAEMSLCRHAWQRQRTDPGGPTYDAAPSTRSTPLGNEIGHPFQHGRWPATALPTGRPGLAGRSIRTLIRLDLEHRVMPNLVPSVRGAS